MADLSEQLFDAIGIIAQNLVKDLQYDKTIICTITDTSRADEGIYTVSSGSAEFQATSNQKYIINTPVYVTIPQNDFNNEKIIVGKYTDANKAYEYIKPSDNFINITDNIINDFSPNGIIANGEITSKSIAVIEKSYEKYNRMVVSTKFKTLFKDNDMPISGNYGLLIQIDGTTDTSQNTYLFDSNDMYGNVYNFIVGNNQEKMFDISNFTRINKIEVKLYQNGEFYNNENNKIVVATEANIRVEELNISLGYALTNYEQDTVVLYTLDDNGFSPDNYTKNLQLKWAHLNQNGQMVSINQNEDPQMTIFEWQLLQYIDGIKWYRWKFKDGVKDDDAGMFWQLLEDNENNSVNLFEKIIELDSEDLPEERFKVIIQFYTNEDLVKIEEDVNKKGWSEIDAILSEYQKVSYTSETIIFDNTEVDQYKTAVELIKNLELTTDDLYNGIYNIYDDDGSLMNESERYKTRSIVAMYKSIYTENEEFDGQETLTWKIPINNTMILLPDDTQPAAEENGYYIIYDDESEPIAEERVNSAGELVGHVRKLQFKIKETYSQSNENNTIICVVNKNNKQYIANIKLVFGTSGTQGTHYTLTLTSGEDRSYIRNTKNSTLRLKASLQDYDGKFIDGLIYTYSISSINPNVIEVNNDGLVTVKQNLAYNESCIASVKITYNGIDLEALYPIAICYNSNDYIIEGASKIVYDNYGVNPVYYKNPYKLFNKADNEEINGLTWRLVGNTYEVIVEGKTEERIKIGYPNLSEDNILKPATFFATTNNQENIKDLVVQAKQGENVIFSQPILIYQNKYGNSLVNEWNGDVIVDTQNEFIGSATIAAGIKNSDNTFSGVILGKDSTANKLGLYGYHEGAQSFGFKEDGTAFIGKSGSGRIEFDGNRGTIQSSSFNEGNGLKIDLDSDKNNPENFPYLHIKENGKTLFKSASSGTTIGKFKLGVDFTAGSEMGYIKSDNGNLILQSNGELKAKAGTIGGWTIEPNNLSRTTSAKNITLGANGLYVGTNSNLMYEPYIYSAEVVENLPEDGENGSKEKIPDKEDMYYIIKDKNKTDLTKYNGYYKPNVDDNMGFYVKDTGETYIKNLVVSDTIDGTASGILKGGRSVSGDELAYSWHTHQLSSSVSEEHTMSKVVKVGNNFYYADQTYWTSAILSGDTSSPSLSAQTIFDVEVIKSNILGTVTHNITLKGNTSGWFEFDNRRTRVVIDGTSISSDTDFYQITYHTETEWY